jgi:hypothetical protein
MSLQQIKQRLLRCTADDDHKVISLSGKWGTGKGDQRHRAAQRAAMKAQPAHAGLAKSEAPD